MLMKLNETDIGHCECKRKRILELEIKLNRHQCVMWFVNETTWNAHKRK